VDGIRDLRDERGRLAYAVRGSGPPLVFIPDLFIPIDSLDDDPPFAQLLDGLASFATVVVMDRSGIGFSDPIADWDRPIFDTWADDVARMIEGVVGGPATVFGFGVQSGLTALRVAQVAPEIVERLVLMNVATVAATSEPSEELIRNVDGESRLDFGSMVAPSRVGDVAYGRWIERAGRHGASPADARGMWEAILATDVADGLDEITVPTTMLLRTGMAWRDAAVGAQAIVDAMPGADLVELTGTDLYPNCGDVDEVVHAVAASMGVAGVQSSGPALLTLLFSDIVASTERSGEMGNARWRGLLDIHDELATKVVARHGGTVVKHTGDGMLATFAMPSRGLRAARALRDELARSDLDVRIGLHTAEVERRGADVNGVGVNVAARIMDLAAGGEILVSAAVPLIVAGAEFSFASRGRHALKGVADEHELFALAGSAVAGRD
jgi:class 3 adenylate cyclase